jgi:hypothetical protein
MWIWVSWEQLYRLKYRVLKFINCCGSGIRCHFDPGSGMEKSRIRNTTKFVLFSGSRKDPRTARCWSAATASRRAIPRARSIPLCSPRRRTSQLRPLVTSRPGFASRLSALSPSGTDGILVRQTKLFKLLFCACLDASVADPWHFGVYPDPRIHSSN